MDYFIGLNDVLLSYDTDLDFSDGDLMSCYGTECVKRDIFKLLITEPGDWKLAPSQGASPNVFIGGQNTRQTAKQIEEYVTNKIQPHVLPAQVTVKVVPLDRESVKCYLDLRIGNEEIASIPFAIDYINGFTYTDYDEVTDTVVSSKDIKHNDTSSVKNPNPFWDRLRTQ